MARITVAYAALGLALAGRALAGAPNFPPVAVIEVSADEVLSGEAICFSGLSSSDPDGGPSPLSYFWDFDDGETSTLPVVEHAYAEPGAYVVSLTVEDGADSSVTVVTVYTLAPPTPGRPSQTSPLALSPDGRELWVANEDSGSVSVIDLDAGEPSAPVVTEIAVRRRPRTVALDPSASRLYVTAEEANHLQVIDTGRREVTRSVPVGHRPYGVLAVPGDGRVLVSLGGEGRVVILDAETLEVRKALAVGDFPRAMAISHDGRTALVTRFISAGAAGQVSVIDLESEEVQANVELPADPSPDTPSSGRGVPNLLGAVAIEPGGRAAWVGGVKSNVFRGLWRDGQPLNSVNRVRGLLAKIDLVGKTEVLARRIDPNNADSVSAVAFSPRGRYAYVTHQGAGSLSVYDLAAAARIDTGDGSTIPFSSRVSAGDAPQGIVLSPDGKRAYVFSFLSRAVAVLDLAVPDKPAHLASIATTAEPLRGGIANGKRMFFRSGAPKHSSAGYIACASCHADGAMHDGQTWDFTDAGEGLRNTVDLRGRGGTAHGPVHWSANFDEIQDFENDIVKGFGGTGLAQDGAGPHSPLGVPNAGRGRDLDDLAAYVASLTAVPPSPHRNPDGSLTETAARGMELFFREDTGCATCHMPPQFTDSTLFPDPAAFVLHDVGTTGPATGGRLGGKLPGLDTPTLKGIWATAPYLHDGSAPTLLDVLATRNPEDRHGRTSHLTPGDLDDLVAYLLALDERSAGDPAPRFRRADSNCDRTVNISDATHSLSWLFMGGPPPCCLEAADANDDLTVDVSDALFTLGWLFLGSAPPPAPGPAACGVDPRPEAGPGCAAYPREEC